MLRLDEVPTPEPGYRKTIAIQQTAGSLQDVPVSVYITSDPDLAELAAEDASDLELVGSDGSALPFEIVEFDGTTGTLDAWVQLPVVLETGTSFELRFGAKRTTSPGQGMWPTTTFAAVWHVESAATEALDSTDNRVHARAASATSTPAAVAGIVGHGFAFDGVDDHLCTDRGDIAAIQPGMQSFSFAAWVHVTASAGEYDSPLTKGGQSDDSAGYSLELGMNYWIAATSDGTASRIANLGGEVQSLGAWTHVATVVDREANRLVTYRNGNMVEMTDLTGYGSLDNSSALLCLGAATRTEDFMLGILDEPRLYARAVPQARFQLEYANFMMRDRFMTVGPTERRAPANGGN